MRPPVASGTVYIKDPVDVWNKEHTIGNAELAARLGSPMTFDRRGTVFAYDDFEDAPLKWTPFFFTLGGGTGNSVTLSDDYPHRGSGCMKIISPNAIDDYSEASQIIYGIAQNNIGVETYLRLSTTNSKSQIVVMVYTGERLVMGGIRIQQDIAGGLSYISGADPTNDASWTSFSTDYPIDTDVAFPIKFVIDIENETYLRCMFAGTEIDMSAYTPYAINNTAFMQRIIAAYYIISTQAASITAYLDNFIFTIEEPE